MNKKILWAALPLLLPFPSISNAVDSASVEYGAGNGAEMWRVGAQWNWQSSWLQHGDWHLGGYWDAQVGQWGGSGKNTITDLGLTPVFRYEETRPSGISPYLEGAVGVHLVSPVRMEERRGFTSAFQFGDHVGVGARLGGYRDVEGRVIPSPGDSDPIARSARQDQEERRDRWGRHHAVDDGIVARASQAEKRRQVVAELFLIEDDYFMDVVGASNDGGVGR